MYVYQQSGRSSGLNAWGKHVCVAAILTAWQPDGWQPDRLAAEVAKTTDKWRTETIIHGDDRCIACITLMGGGIDTCIYVLSQLFVALSSLRLSVRTCIVIRQNGTPR